MDDIFIVSELLQERDCKLATQKWNIAMVIDNRPIQAKCIASVTNCSLGLETSGNSNFSLTVNTGNLSANYFILHGD